MFGIGLLEVVIIVAIIMVLTLVGGLARRAGAIRVLGPTLVLRKFYVDETSSSNTLVDIVGRASGMTAWLLTTIGFDTETSLYVTAKEIYLKSSSIFGQTHQVVPLPTVSSTHCGYSKPVGHLITGLIFFLGGLILGLGQRGGGLFFILGLIIGAMSIVAYYLYKKIVISVETSGGRNIGICFKRSVIENVDIDIANALKAINIINNKMVESQMR